MKMKKLILLSLLLIVSTAIQSQSIDKHRVIVLTDIENTNGEEPDDEQSLVRFLVYTNHFDVEGIIATTSIHLQNETREARIREIVRAYGKVRDNLNLHEPGFPTESFLQSRVKAGSSRFGMLGVGPDMDSEGSEWIIQVVDQRKGITDRCGFLFGVEPIPLLRRCGKYRKPVLRNNLPFLSQNSGFMLYPIRTTQAPGSEKSFLICFIL
jgi:hypothetical protein